MFTNDRLCKQHYHSQTTHIHVLPLHLKQNDQNHNDDCCHDYHNENNNTRGNCCNLLIVISLGRQRCYINKSIERSILYNSKIFTAHAGQGAHVIIVIVITLLTGPPVVLQVVNNVTSIDSISDVSWNGFVT